MLCAPRVSDTFGWSDQFLFRFGLLPRDSCSKSSTSMRGNMPPSAWLGSWSTRLAGQNSVASKLNASIDWLHSRKYV